ncbi:MAG: glycosyltransferase family 4 protein [Clostridiales bacterium]|jgi:1,2-diacylglycerol 3-alpha-glucosyltransferase|nr:glycosyltransferase family 4 protein [Clostridiales bacterium]
MVAGIFTDTFYPEINGVATSVMLLKRELERLGHTVYVVTCSNPALRGGADIENTFRLPSAPFIFLPSRRMAVLYKKSVARKIKSLGLDIIHTNTEFSLGMFGKLMAAALNKPNIHTYHTLYEDYVHYITKGKFPNFSAEMARLFSKKFCNGCDAVITPTDKIRDLLLEYSVDRPISVIPTGIDIEQFSGAAAGAGGEAEIAALRRELGIGPGDKVILYVGRLAREKNIDGIMSQLPRCMKAEPGAKFLLVGDGPWKKELEALACEGGIRDRVIFAGERPWRDIAKFYKLGDVFISASLSETQGLTFIEAMAAGLPVLAKRDRSVEKLIYDGRTGCLFDDDAEIPGKLGKILGDASFREGLVSGAMGIAAQNSAAQFAKSIEAAYAGTIRGWQPVGKKYILSKKVLQKIIM